MSVHWKFQSKFSPDRLKCRWSVSNAADFFVHFVIFVQLSCFCNKVYLFVSYPTFFYFFEFSNHCAMFRPLCLHRSCLSFWCRSRQSFWQWSVRRLYPSRLKTFFKAFRYFDKRQANTNGSRRDFRKTVIFVATPAIFSERLAFVFCPE